MSESFVEQQLKSLEKDEEALMRMMESFIYIQEDILERHRDIFRRKLQLSKL